MVRSRCRSRGVQVAAGAPVDLEWECTALRKGPVDISVVADAAPGAEAAVAVEYPLSVHGCVLLTEAVS